MHTRMLVRDVRRNPVVTSLLVVLMALAALLAATSTGTLARLVASSSALLDRAAAPHVAQLHAGELDRDALDDWVAGRPEVEHHQVQLLLGIAGDALSLDGVPQTSSIQQNSLVLPNTERDLLLDLDNRPITQVTPGTVVLPVLYQVEDGVEVGDLVTITGADGFVTELTVAGFARDSIMNPALASSKRLAVAPADLAEISAHTGTVEHLVEFWLHDPGPQSAAFQKAYQDSSMPAAGQMVDRATFQMFTMVGDGMVAAIVILVAVLLLVVAMLCLRFAFVTAVEQDRQEIGVLTAIGAPSRAVKRIYLTKYTVMAAAASVLGLLGGWALIPLLTRDLTRYMGSVPNPWAVAVPVLAAGSVLVALVLFVLLLLRRLNRVSAVEALRQGTGGRRAGASPLRLHRSRMPVHVRLGLMDVVGRWPSYLVLLVVLAVSTFVLVVPIASAVTASSPAFVTYMGTGAVDLRIELRHTDDPPAAFAALVERVQDDPDVAVVAPLVTTRNDTLDQEGSTVSLYVANGDHTVLPVTYVDGRAPQDGTEVALSLLALNQVGRAVGEDLPVTVGGVVRDLTIVGSYQDITNGGTTAKSVLPTEGEDVVWSVVGVGLVPGVDATAKAAELAPVVAPATIADIGQWRLQTLGPIARQMTVTALVAAGVALALAALMTGLFARMLMVRDARQIAVQRALGAGDGGLRRQYLTRFLLVLAVGVVVGTVAAATLGESLFNLMFEGLYGGLEAFGRGTSRIDLDVSPVLTVLALPAALAAAVTAATAAATRTVPDIGTATLTTE